MSISSEISRLQTDRTAIQSALVAQGVSAASSHGFDDFAADIASISGGGSSRLVTGKFTANSTTGVQNVTIPYTGNGYPIAAIVCLSDGLTSANPAWYNLVHRYAIGFWAMFKNSQSTAPTYTTSGDANSAVTMTTYKNSTTSATTYARGGDIGTNTFSSSNATAASSTCVRFKSATEMSIYIAATGTGLAAGLDFDYIIVYSS